MTMNEATSIQLPAERPQLVSPARDGTAHCAIPALRARPGESSRQGMVAPLTSGASCFFIGIGGCGMSGLAREFASRGGVVSGVDRTPSETTAALEQEGVLIHPDDERAALPDRCDLVVISAAVKPDHPLLALVAARGLPILHYAQALGWCMEGRTAVAVAGAHGKSTTAAMLAVALTSAGLDPSVIVGANVPELAQTPGGPSLGHRVGAAVIPTGSRAGQPGIFIAEACEFNRSFHNLRPMIASIGVIEADHLDIYGSLDALVEAYAAFARLVAPAEEGGLLLIGHDGAHRRVVAADVSCRVETIGFSPEADWRVELHHISKTDDAPNLMTSVNAVPPEHEASCGDITLLHLGERVAQWTCPMPGEHNVFNSAVAMAISLSLGARAEAVAEALSRFRGVQRRTEFLGERRCPDGGVVRVYDDYGHHPTEVDATLRAVKASEKPAEHGGRLICVFQPHQHSRTRFLLNEFAQSFSQADMVIVPPIYFVRDSELEKSLVSSGDLVDRLRERGVSASNVDSFEAIVALLDRECRAGDVLVVMGAGPVWRVAHGFMDGQPAGGTQ